MGSIFRKLRERRPIASVLGWSYARRMATPGTQLALRLDPALLAKIDRLAEKMSTAAMRVSRSEAIRTILEHGLPIAEAEADRVAAARVAPAKGKGK